MISRTRCAPRALTLAIASSSLVLAIPLQAREHAVKPPAAPAAVSETPPPTVRMRSTRISRVASPVVRAVTELPAVCTSVSVMLPVEVSETPQAPSSRSSVVVIPVPLPLPGQLKSLPQAEPPAAGRSRPSRSHPAPRDRVGAANEAARVQPDRTGFINAIQLYPFTKGAL